MKTLRPSRYFVAPALLAFFLLHPHFANTTGTVRAQSQLSGNVQVRVRSADRQEAIIGAEVTLVFSGRMESNLNGYTDGAGRAVFEGIRSGGYEIVVEKDGYETVRERVIINANVRESFFIQLRKTAESRGADAVATASARNADVPDGARKAYDEGVAALKDDPGKSVEHFRRATEAYPKYADAYLMLGLAQLRSGGKTAEALQSLAKAIELDPKLAQAHLLIGKIHLEDKKLDAAEKPLRESVGLDPQGWEPHFQLARCLFNTNRLDEALRHARRALELPAASPLTHLLLSDIYIARNERKDALRELERFTRADPKSPLMPRVQQMIARLRTEDAQK